MAAVLLDGRTISLFRIALEMEKQEGKANKNNPLYNPPNTTNVSTDSSNSNSSSSRVRTTKTPEWPEIELLMAEDLAFNNFEQIFGDCTNTNNMFYNNHTMSHFQ